MTNAYAYAEEVGTGVTTPRFLFAHQSPAAVRVCRYSDAPECDVIVSFRGREMLVRCRDFDQARTWARMECRAYGVAAGFTIERY